MSNTLETYRELRAKGCNATSAFKYARAQAKATRRKAGPSFGKWDTEWRSEWKQGPYTLVARVEYDDCSGLEPDYIGDIYPDRKQPGGAIPLNAHNPREGWAALEPHRTYAHVRAELLRMKYGKAAADLMARRQQAADVDRLRQWASNNWTYVYVQVTVSLHGVELGSASVGGIESDSGPEYFEETARELATEALDEARATRAKLCGRVK